MKHLSLTLLAAALAAGLAHAQCTPLPPLTTLTTAGNGQNGTMFDIVNVSALPIAVQGLDQCFFSGASDNVLVYTKTGSWNGSQTNAAAWTLVGQANAVPHGIAPQLDPLPITMSIVIPPGATQGFYVTGDVAATVAYTTGTNQLGTVIGTDGILEVRAGIGVAYPFGGNFGLPTAGRLWNGRVHHCGGGSGGTAATNTPIGSGCVRSFNSFFEVFADAAAASAALTGNVLFLSPTPSGYQGTWVPGAASAFYVAPVAATPLATGDDGVVALTPSAPLATPYGPQATLQVSGNGIIGFGAGTLDYPGTSAYTPTGAGMLNAALGGIYAWHDYNSAEAGSGAIVQEESGGVLYVTFAGVENYANPEVANPSTLQFQLELATGVVRIVWLTVDGNASSTWGSGHLVGVSAPGVSADPGPIVLATATAAQLLTSSPETLPLALSAATRPVTGTTWSLQVGAIPATGTLGVEILGLADPGLDDLAFLGMPGCGLRASLDFVNAFVVTGATHSFGLAVPANPALVGVHVYATAAVALSPAVNSFGFVTSNGIDGLIGNL